MEELPKMDEQLITKNMAKLKDLRSWHCFMLGGKSLNNLAPKFARAKLNLSLDSLRPSLLPSLLIFQA